MQLAMGAQLAQATCVGCTGTSEGLDEGARHLPGDRTQGQERNEERLLLTATESHYVSLRGDMKSENRHNAIDSGGVDGLAGYTAIT